MVMSPARRPASELPSDPARLQLIYTHGHPAVPYAFEDTLEHWSVSVRAYHDDDEECEGGCSPDCDALIESGSEIGRLGLWRLRDYTGTDRWEAADAESGDLESIAATVFDGGRYSAAFEEAIECPVGDLLILDRVLLSKPWRGFGLGPVFAAEAIRRLSGGCCAVAAEPGMAEWPDDKDEVSEEHRAQAKEKIAALWESIGFQSFQGGVQLLDTSLREPGDLHQQRRSDLEELSAAYQAHQDGWPASSGSRPAPAPATAPQPAPARPDLQSAKDDEDDEDDDRLTTASSLRYLQQRCAQSGWSTQDRTTALNAAALATSGTDLRELADQVKGVHFGLRDAWTEALTFPARDFAIRPFTSDPTRLGPLADVWVYGSNLTGQFEGRSHALGGACQHSRPLGPHTERMTLGQLVHLTSFWERYGPSCSLCQGWSGQRLTPDQHAHYLRAVAAQRR